MRTTWRAALVAVLTTGAVLTSLGAPPGAVAKSDRGAVPAEGAFIAEVDFGSLTATPTRGNKCTFVVNGALTFDGTLEGIADGVTTAIIFAPCDDALANPPGTFFDVFRFVGDFDGTVAGEPTTGPLTYGGITRVGGHIDALIRLRGDAATAVLRADATVAVGGDYAGVARVR